MKLKGITDTGMKRVAQATDSGRDINEVLEEQAVTMDHIVDALYTLREADCDLFSQFGVAKFHEAMNAMHDLIDDPDKTFVEFG